MTSLPGRLRSRFPIFERKAYVNSCSQGALSDAVRAAYDAYLADWEDQGSPWELWVAKVEAVRAAFAGLVGAEPDEVAATASVSAGVSALASALRFDQGRDTVVVSDFEFPTIGQIWHAQERRGARVVHVPEAPDHTIPLAHFEAAIDDRTALVSVTSVCYRNGARTDVEAVTRLAHERGALVLLDSYQAAGALPIDVRALGVDFLAAGALKYLLASAGLGFFYCRRDLVERLVPTATGWFADRDVFTMDVTDYSPSPTARRFEAGTPPIPAVYAALAGIGLVREAGVPKIARHVEDLNTALIDGVAALGGRVVTPKGPEHRGPLVAIAATDAPALAAALTEDGVVVSSRDGNLRVSPHLYNDASDVEAVLRSLARSRHLLRG